MRIMEITKAVSPVVDGRFFIAEVQITAHAPIRHQEHKERARIVVAVNNWIVDDARITVLGVDELRGQVRIFVLGSVSVFGTSPDEIVEKLRNQPVKVFGTWLNGPCSNANVEVLSVSEEGI